MTCLISKVSWATHMGIQTLITNISRTANTQNWIYNIFLPHGTLNCKLESSLIKKKKTSAQRGLRNVNKRLQIPSVFSLTSNKYAGMYSYRWLYPNTPSLVISKAGPSWRSIWISTVPPLRFLRPELAIYIMVEDKSCDTPRWIRFYLPRHLEN